MENQNFTDREEQKRNLRKGMLVNEEEQTEDSEERFLNRDFEKEIRAYKRKRRLIILAVVLVLVIVAAVWYFIDRSRTYRSMTVSWSQTVEVSSFEGAVGFVDGLLVYGRNSASYVAQDGTVMWTESYEMSNPAAVICGEYAAICDQGGIDLIICNAGGKQGQIQTSSPIMRMALAGQGMAVVIQEDTRAEYVSFYDHTGKKLDIEIKTPLQGDGYPLDLAVSQSGEQLMVSYVYVENATLKNKVVFYNFDVGQDMVDRIVGGFEQYEDTMVPRVTYLNETQAVAFGDKLLTFYSLKNQLKPKTVQEYTVEDEITKVFYGDDQVGVVTVPKEKGAAAHLTVYNSAGEVQREIDFSEDFSKIEFVGNEILVYNEKGFRIYNADGSLKYQEDTGYDLSAVVPGTDKKTYYLIGNGMLQKAVMH